MGIFFESGKDLPFISSAQITPTAPTAIQLWETFTFTLLVLGKSTENYIWKKPKGCLEMFSSEKAEHLSGLALNSKTLPVQKHGSNSKAHFLAWLSYIISKEYNFLVLHRK